MGKGKYRYLKASLLALASLFFVGLSCLFLLLLWLWHQSDVPEFDTSAAQGISYSRLKTLVPGPGLPAKLDMMDANNNLDAVRFGDRIFVGFRTAPNHFASPKTRTIVLSSLDRKTWELEAEVTMQDGDMREPRFLAFRDRLFFHFFKAGSNPAAFEPSMSFQMERLSKGNWTEPEPIGEKAHVMWCFKQRDGVAYRSVYDGGGLYSLSLDKGDVRLHRSEDGENWTPLSDKPQVNLPYASECAFEFDEEGNLVAVVRIEMKGSLVCRADADDLGEWTCNFTPFKHDSPVMFRHGKDFYVVSRRNVAGSFWRDLPLMGEKADRAWSLARYSLTRKRTCLFKVNVETLELRPLFDFPSKGDTAFPAIMRLDERSYMLLNYSNRLEGRDLPWLFGQLRPTHIYETVLTFS